MRTLAVYIISTPILVVGIVFDIVKFPFLIFFLWPLWAFIDLLAVLRGERSMILEMMAETSVIGILVWMDCVGLHRPRWAR